MSEALASITTTSDRTTVPDCIEIECLACGCRRLVQALSHDAVKECPRCGYLGWARPEALSESERQWFSGELFGVEQSTHRRVE
jgi:hypothetical protein